MSHFSGRTRTRFEIVTDHCPLVPILNRYCLNEIGNPCLQCLRMKLLPYKFTATWRSGKHCVPDAVSKAPVRDLVQEDQLAEEEVEWHVRAVIVANHESQDDVNLENLCRVAEQDNEYQDLYK